MHVSVIIAWWKLIVEAWAKCQNLEVWFMIGYSGIAAIMLVFFHWIMWQRSERTGNQWKLKKRKWFELVHEKIMDDRKTKSLFWIGSLWTKGEITAWKERKRKKELEIFAIYIHIAWFSLSVHSIPLYAVLYFHQLIIRLFLRHVFT